MAAPRPAARRRAPVLALTLLLTLLAPAHAGQPVTAVPYAPAIAVIDLFGPDTAFWHQSSSGRSTLDEHETVRGRASLRIDTDGDGVQVNVRAVDLPPVDLRNAHLRVVLRSDQPDALEDLLIYLSSDGFASYDTYRVLGGDDDTAAYAGAGDWITTTVTLGTPLASVGAAVVDLGRVTGVQFSVLDAGAGPVTVWLDALEAVARPARGVVSIVFDDARDGAYRLARPLLDRHGFRANVAVVVDLVGTPGFMSLDELRTVERYAGWDVIAHHASALPDEVGFDGLADAEVAAELERVRAWLVAHGFRRGADHLAFPHGGFDPRVIELARRHFASARTIVAGLGLETLPPADPYRIRAWSVTRDDPPEALMAAIDRAARDRAWLVLVFHQLVDSPAEAATTYAVADMARVVAHLAAADVDVLTLPEALALPPPRPPR